MDEKRIDLNDPILPGQTYVLVSFYPVGKEGRKRDVVAYAKVRGSFSNYKEAEKKGKELIKEYTPNDKIYIQQMGKHFPITFNAKDISKHVDNIVKVDIDNEVKQKERFEIQDIVDTKKTIKKMQEYDKKIKDNDGVYPETEIEKFITLQCRRASSRSRYLKYIKGVEKEEKLFGDLNVIIKEMELKHPTFRRTFRRHYNKVRAEKGIPKNMEDDISINIGINHLRIIKKNEEKLKELIKIREN